MNSALFVSFSISYFLSCSRLLWAQLRRYNRGVVKTFCLRKHFSFTMYKYNHIRMFFIVLHIKSKPVCVRLQQKSPITCYIFPNKHMQIYHRRLKQTWLSNLSISFDNIYTVGIFFCSARISACCVQQGNPEVHHVRFGSSAFIWLCLLLK